MSKTAFNGLTDKEVLDRINNNKVNYDTTVPTKSIKEIFANNFFTLFNILNLILGIIVFLVGSYKNMLFLLIVIINTAISTIQEIHSKKIVDKLSILSTTKVKVIRNGIKKEIPINSIVLDDILEFSLGDQIPTDCVILDGEVLVNESLITGEADSITKKENSTILSGSYVVSGRCLAKVIHIAEENYTSKISKGAKYVKKVNSDIMNSLNKIIKFLSFVIIPIGISLFLSQYFLQHEPLENSALQTVAAIIGMIPEGLVLLASTVLAISVIRLSKFKVLIQDLYSIETLARVDTLCLDKTGTLTKGTMEVKNYVTKSISDDEFCNILSNFSYFSEDENKTILAIKEKFNNTNDKFNVIKKFPFSSEKKYSAISFENKGTYILGAPEFILGSLYDKYMDEINEYSKDYRVLALLHTKIDFDGQKIPSNKELLGFIFLLDNIRTDANKTIKYFKDQGVDIKLISGDNPITVSKIAKRVGIDAYENYIDMSKVPEDKDLKEISIKYTIFGRVSPTQKEKLIKALKSNRKNCCNDRRPELMMFWL